MTMLTNRKYQGTKDDRLGQVQALSDQELELFWHILSLHASKRDRAMLYLAYTHAMRAGEIAYLTVGDVDLDARQITITAFKRKRDPKMPLTWDNRPVFIELLREKELELLKDYLQERGVSQVEEPLFKSRNGGTLDRTQIFRIYQKYAILTGLPPHKQHIHCLRHSLGHKLRKEGYKVEDVQKMLRHSVLETTNKFYYTMNLDEKLDLQDKMSGFL